MNAPTRRARWAVASVLAVCAGAAATISTHVQACNPDYLPLCGRSAYLAKFVNQVVVNPAAAAPVTVPVGLVPYVEWNDQNPALCAQPTSHSLSLTVSCVPQAGGAAVVFGPVNVPMQDTKPTVPGNQPVAGGSPFSLVLPPGTLTPGVAFRCTVTGRYVIDFGPTNKRGFGQIIGTGDTQFSALPSAPADVTQPILYVKLASGRGMGFTRAQPGDQVHEAYVVANNHPTLPVFIDVLLDTSTVAKTPLLGAGSTADTVYPVSTDTPNGDRYAIRVGESVRPGAIIPRDDPLVTTGTPTLSSIVLGPYETTILNVIRASHGMCLDGSCSEDILDFRGTWLDPAAGDPLSFTAIVGTALQTDRSAPLRNAFCRVEDTVTASSRADVRWSPAMHGGTFRWATFGYGNHPEPQILDHSFRTVAANLTAAIGLQPGEYPTTATSVTRFDAAEDWLPSATSFNMVAFVLNGAGTAFLTQGMQVQITGIPATGTEIDIPAIARNEAASDLWLFLGLGEIPHYDVKEKQGNRLVRVASGSLAELQANPAIHVNTDVVRKLRYLCEPDLLKRLEAQIAYARFFFGAEETVRVLPGALTVFNGRNPDDVGVATGTSSAHVSIAPTFSFNQPVDVTVDLTGTPLAPAEPLVEKLVIGHADAMKDLRLYLALRRAPPLVADTLTVDRTSITLDAAKSSADTLALTLRVAIPAGFVPEGKLSVSIGARADIFQASGKNKWSYVLAGLGPTKKAKKPPAPKLSVKYKKQGGTVPAQQATVKYTFSKAELAGYFFGEGLRDEDVAGKVIGLPVRVCVNDACFAGTAAVVVNATKGKKLTAKTPK